VAEHADVGMSAPSQPSRRVLTVNAGSSSVKLRLIDGDDSVAASTDTAYDPTAGSIDGVVEAIEAMGPADVVAHRVVHGGQWFHDAAVIDDAVVAQLEELVPLAPLHQPAALRLIAAAREARPAIPAVACFDTAFHAGMPEAAHTYAVPSSWRERFGLRRYGFHGLSHDYASGRACEVLGIHRADMRVVVCHLGAGASVCAVDRGRSVDTSMGFTPLEGLVMATRSGTIDPGAVLWLVEQGGLRPEEVREDLEHRSGMLALAGTADMRTIVDRAGDGDAVATAALDVYVHRLRREIAGMVAAMDGLDVLVFTGGIGERSAVVRQAACAGMTHLGVALDDAANLGAEGDADIGAAGAGVGTVVVAAREDLAMAHAARASLRR
jgi:acetate kinase